MKTAKEPVGGENILEPSELENTDWRARAAAPTRGLTSGLMVCLGDETMGKTGLSIISRQAFPERVHVPRCLNQYWPPKYTSK